MENQTSPLGLLIDYEFCTGCHSCEVACKVEHEMPEGQWGIQVKKIGPQQMPDGRWDFHYLPAPTALCDLCEARVEEGRWPTCVHHCQAQVIEYGPVAELAQKMTKRFMVLYTPVG